MTTAGSGAEILCVFLRALISGRVKTRLAADVGNEAALDLYRAMLEDLYGRLTTSTRRVIMPFVDRPGPTGPFENLRIQRGENLFDRMANAIEEAIDNGGDRVVLIGTDIPLLTSSRIDSFFARFPRKDAIIGPSADGGYYAVGFTATGYRRHVLTEPERSRESDVLATTEEAMRAAGLDHCRGPILRDVDTLADLLATLQEPESRLACPNLHRAAANLGLRRK